MSHIPPTAERQPTRPYKFCRSKKDANEAKRREIDEQKHITLSQKNIDFITNDDPGKEQKRYAAFLSRRESISAESPIPFPEYTSMPYSGFESEATRLQVECHNRHTGWGGNNKRSKWTQSLEC
ncbi:hypothetical protein TNCV_3503791 [Trichonephila clavipes]|uniref:Uncharacterized protein n=1 Tax=Trichonephila clavipes TaxID=2585209 RepID=A0A8X6VC55_TRICX|nr:hypothetical protein TNCV_3503791 [Trichonephila clavipes]